MKVNWPIPKTKKCVVLDLDNTLLCSFSTNKIPLPTQALTDPKLIGLRGRLYSGTVMTEEKIPRPSEYWGVKRPHLEEFLDFCFQYFEIVAVWTAGITSYAKAICKVIFGTRQPHVIFSQSQTVFDELGDSYKPLTKMIDSNPALTRMMSLANTVIVDDNITNFFYNTENGILIPKYEPNPTIADLTADDDELTKIKAWFLMSEVIDATNVTELVKANLFRYPLSAYQERLRQDHEPVVVK